MEEEEEEQGGHVLSELVGFKPFLVFLRTFWDRTAWCYTLFLWSC